MSAQARPGAWQIGTWIADPSADTLTRGSECQKIEPRMMRLLLCLAEASGKVVSQEQLLAEVWAGVIVGPASVYQSVSQLRKVLGDTSTPPSYIETIARKGYRLIAPATALPSSEPASRVRGAANADADATTGVPAAQSPRRRPIARWMPSLGVGALLIGLGVAAFLWWRPTSVAAAPSIAVLPLVDMTAGKSQQPFCDGFTEELSNWLAQIPTLRVVARSSASAFRNKPTDAREIGRVLGTTHVLEGSLRRSGNVLRVTIQLVATRDGYNVWSSSYDAPVTDALDVQEQVAHAVANNLELRLTDATRANFADRRSTSARAYSLYLVARHHQQQQTKQDNERAIELYKEALVADPDFALAQVGLAHAYLNRRYFSDSRIAEIAQQAEPLLAQAQRSAPRLPELYVVRAALETELLQNDAALRDLRYATSLNPNLSDAASELGFHYLVNGEPQQALESFSRAAELDPLDYNVQAQRCIALSDLGRFDGASAACERARELGPGAAWVYSASSQFEEARGRTGEALKWNAAALARSPDVQEVYAERARWFMSLSLIDRARECFDKAWAVAGDAAPNDRLTSVGLITAYALSGPAAMREWLASSGLTSTGDPALLFELADAELIAGDPRAARGFADRALASPDLRPDDLASPWLARQGESYLLIAAATQKLTGDAAEANKSLAKLDALLERLIAGGMRRHGVYELQAQAAALRGDPEGAMQALQRAASQGWRDVWFAEHEPYFSLLRSRADFAGLIERVRQDNESERSKLGSQLSAGLSP
ncbi:MAG TPA: winged helix-turn-helix domain-containing protein [Steroidobacteraceae bacterium]|nr:winged helix-turn-helix domain-containing protein [Steroidobacteraceae bacterium]